MGVPLILEKLCLDCGDPIPQGRVEALPETLTCVGCSQVRPRSILDVDVEGADVADLARSAATPDREGR